MVHDVLHTASIGEVTAIETYLGTNATQNTPTGANSVLNSTSATVATWTTTPTLVDVIITTPSNTAGHVVTVDGTQNLTSKTYNKVTLTAPATGSTLTIADGKTLTANNSLTLVGVDATTQTFQASDTIVGRATTDTLTNKTLTSPIINTPTFSAGAVGTAAIASNSVTNAKLLKTDFVQAGRQLFSGNGTPQVSVPITFPTAWVDTNYFMTANIDGSIGTGGSNAIIAIDQGSAKSTTTINLNVQLYTGTLVSGTNNYAVYWIAVHN